MDAENVPTAPWKSLRDFHKHQAASSGEEFKNGQRRRACARLGLTRYSQPLPLAGFQTFGKHFVPEDDESMKPPSNVKTPAQYLASLPAGRAKTIATVRALVNKHIPRGYDECLVWGTIGWTIPLSRYPDTYNKQPICYVALSSQKNYCFAVPDGRVLERESARAVEGGVQAAGKRLEHMGSVAFISSRRTICRSKRLVS